MRRSGTRSKLPGFLRVSLDEPSRSDLASTAEALHEALAPRPPSPGRLEALLGSVAALPLRYAPFFEDLCDLFDIPEQALREALAQAGDESRWQASPELGLSIFEMPGGARVEGATRILARLQPCQSFPQHEHLGVERVVVLEGGYVDDRGRTFHPGDKDDNPARSCHSIRALSDGPCIAAVVHYGIELGSSAQ